MRITDVHQAWEYYHKFRTGYMPIDHFKSQSKHDGAPGITHIISSANMELEYLTRKSYWANPIICKVNDLSKLPEADRSPNSKGETIKTKMFAMIQGKIKHQLKDHPIDRITHVTVMENGEWYVFDARKIVEYTMKYDSFCDHPFEGVRGAVYYPRRLAEESLTKHKVEI